MRAHLEVSGEESCPRCSRPGMRNCSPRTRRGSERWICLHAENSRLKTSERLMFTLIGGLFIVIGIVMGLFHPDGQRRAQEARD
ncbi:MAG: hypothetical protein MZU91_02800 [Desulfosudis oleivorans]|nr:hypothetical protein [Desulfosudis oleivorans]